MAIGDKNGVVMQSDRAVPGGIATLGADGKLLDAQIPGLAKLGAAPAEYGLGGAARSTDDFNTCVNNGWYCGLGALNAPSFATYASYGLLLVLRQSGSLIVQIYYAYLPKNGIPNLTIAMRTSADSGVSWEEWEYDNPPMLTGAEYRTTERYLGKPVYTKLVDLGEAANSKIVSPDIGGGAIIRHHAIASGVNPLPFINATLDNSYSLWTAVEGGGTQIKIFCGSNRAGTQITAQLWYIKN